MTADYGKRKRERLVIGGPVYEDDVTFNGITAKKLQIYVTDFTTHGDNDALVGMQYRTASSGIGYTWFFETLIQQNSVQALESGFYFGFGENTTNSNGKITLGGRDQSRFTGSFTTTSVVKQSFAWQIQLEGLSFGGKEYRYKSYPTGRYQCSTLHQLRLNLY